MKINRVFSTFRHYIVLVLGVNVYSTNEKNHFLINLYRELENVKLLKFFFFAKSFMPFYYSNIFVNIKRRRTRLL